MILYIAGPMTADTEVEYTQNIAWAAMIGEILFKMGHKVFIPHCNTGHIRVPFSEIMDQDLTFLRMCQGIVLLKGWERSEGTKVELEEAKRVGLQVYTVDEALQKDKISV